MKITVFKKLLKNEKIPICKSPKNDLQYVKKLIADNIDFGCNFKDGKCKENRGRQCCCHSCLIKVGFLKFIYKEDLLKYARNFSINTGFWRKEKGCVLPYELRSAMCVFWNCHSDEKTHYALTFLNRAFDGDEVEKRKELLNYQKIKTEIIDGRS